MTGLSLRGSEVGLVSDGWGSGEAGLMSPVVASRWELAVDGSSSGCVALVL